MAPLICSSLLIQDLLPLGKRPSVAKACQSELASVRACAAVCESGLIADFGACGFLGGDHPLAIPLIGLPLGMSRSKTMPLMFRRRMVRLRIC